MCVCVSLRRPSHAFDGKDLDVWIQRVVLSLCVQCISHVIDGGFTAQWCLCVCVLCVCVCVVVLDPVIFETGAVILLGGCVGTNASSPTGETMT